MSLVKDVGQVARLNGSTSSPSGRALFNIKLYGKMVSKDIYLMNYNTPWMGAMAYSIKLVSKVSYWYYDLLKYEEINGMF